MISFDERCYSNQYDEISDDEFSDDEISGFANTTKFLATKFPPPGRGDIVEEIPLFVINRIRIFRRRLNSPKMVRHSVAYFPTVTVSRPGKFAPNDGKCLRFRFTDLHRVHWLKFDAFLHVSALLSDRLNIGDETVLKRMLIRPYTCITYRNLYFDNMYLAKFKKFSPTLMFFNLKKAFLKYFCLNLQVLVIID